VSKIRIDGNELAKLVREINPKQKIILWTDVPVIDPGRSSWLTDEIRAQLANIRRQTRAVLGEARQYTDAIFFKGDFLKDKYSLISTAKKLCEEAAASPVENNKEMSSSGTPSITIQNLDTPIFLNRIKEGDIFAYSKLIEALYLYIGVHDLPEIARLERIFSNIGINISEVVNEISRRINQELNLILEYRTLMRRKLGVIDELSSKIDNAFLARRNNLKKVSLQRAGEFIARLRHTVYFEAEGTIWKALEFCGKNVYVYKDTILKENKTYELEQVIFKLDKAHYLPEGAVNY
ncbi:MAG: hypothetical protein KJ923_01250, partial [Candidatus Omnitrophica bacterium]|nr:hypothetical protein [Candidatus Omnitrophota bacterium]